MGGTTVFDKNWYDLFMLMSLVANAIAFYVLGKIIPGVRIAGWETLLLVSVVWGVMAMLLRPILIIFTLPVNVLTLGLFTFVINALLIMLTARIVPGFEIAGFGTALLTAVGLAILNMFLGNLK